MLNVKHLWIGDLLRIKADGRVASFEGEVNGKLKIRIGDKVILLDAEQLEIAPEKDTKEKNGEQDLQSFDPIHFETTLDLHLEALDPSRKHESPIQIRAYQMRRCREFIQEAIRLKIRGVVIIHGKGEGVLKSDVLNLLSKFSEIIDREEVHSGGAQRIKFSH